MAADKMVGSGSIEAEPDVEKILPIHRDWMWKTTWISLCAVRCADRIRFRLEGSPAKG